MSWLLSAIARVEDGEGRIVGAALAVRPAGRVVTCAHVVNHALGRPYDHPTRPDSPISLHFLEAGVRVRGKVIAWSPWEEQDVAVLEIADEDEPTFRARVRPVPLYRMGRLEGRRFRAFGFPRGYPQGRWAYGDLQGKIPTGRIQARSGELGAGYSGGPVQETQMGRVVGLISAVDEPGARAFLIPVQAIAEVCEGIERLESHFPFSPLTDGLTGPSVTDVEHFWEVYLGTPENPVPFGGRRDAWPRWTPGSRIPTIPMPSSLSPPAGASRPCWPGGWRMWWPATGPRWPSCR